MKYYSTNHQSPVASLEEAVVKDWLPTKDYLCPKLLKCCRKSFMITSSTCLFQEIAYRVADAFFGEDVPADTLKQIVYDTLSF